MEPAKCAVCGKEARFSKQPQKRPLCRECYEAAKNYSAVRARGVISYNPGPEFIPYEPKDGYIDPYEGKSRLLEE